MKSIGQVIGNALRPHPSRWKPKTAHVEVARLVQGFEGEWVIQAEITPEEDITVTSVVADEGTTGTPPTAMQCEADPNVIELLREAAHVWWSEQHQRWEDAREAALELRADIEREDRHA